VAHVVITQRPGRRPWDRLIVTSAVVGLVFGPLDLAGQVHTPYPYANLFNSPAVWAALAYVVGRWATELTQAAVGAVVALVVAVEAYYVADVFFRGANTSNLWSTTAVVWLALGVGGGVVFGLAGALSRRAPSWTAAIAAATLPAVFLAEAARSARTDFGGPGWVALLVVVAVAAMLWVLRGAGRSEVQRTLLCVAAWTALGFLAYLPFG
jgi:hypothetical protein